MNSDGRTSSRPPLHHQHHHLTKTTTISITTTATATTNARTRTHLAESLRAHVTCCYCSDPVDNVPRGCGRDAVWGATALLAQARGRAGSVHTGPARRSRRCCSASRRVSPRAGCGGSCGQAHLLIGVCALSHYKKMNMCVGLRADPSHSCLLRRVAFPLDRIMSVARPRHPCASHSCVGTGSMGAPSICSAD